jgi:uncharacterized protein YeeX (DUF496 family)
MTMSQGIEMGLAMLGAGSTALVWVVAAMLAPVKKDIKASDDRMQLLIANIKVSIDNSTAVMMDIKQMSKDHEDRLDDHHDRIAKIETVHLMRRCHDLGEHN